jgi:nitrogen fixation protein NifU and related proteins
MLGFGRERQSGVESPHSKMFSERLLDYFQNPRNAGELANASTKVEVSNPACGDVLHLAAIVEDGVVRDLRFLCRGCTAAIACASLLTETIKGREVKQLKSVNAAGLAEKLGGLPSGSFHAAQLAEDGLKALIKASSSR